MVDLLSWTFSATCFFLTLYLIRNAGYMEGGRPVWVMALLLIPVWFQTRVATFTIDPRTACALALLIGFLQQRVHVRESANWYFADLAIILLCAGITVTQLVRESAMPLAPLDEIRQLVLPYVVGRLFLRTARDIDSILPAFCAATTILAAYALVEGLVAKNPLEFVLGRPWLKNAEGFDEIRFHLKRAYGPQTHPIYLGLTFAMLMPWALEAAVKSWHKRGPLWWQFVPLFDCVGVIVTGSRAAQIAVLVVLVMFVFQAVPRWRLPILCLGLAAGFAFLAARDELIDILGQYIAESREGTAYVLIDGELHEYSGTKHRDLLDIVYKDAIDHNDWLGYGASTKRVPKDPQMDERFESIDNHYLRWFLQFGRLGLVLFALLAFCFLWNLLPSMLWSTGPPGRLAGGLFGAMAGTLIAMRGVWLAPDYAWVWLFCGGLSVGLARMRRAAAEGATPSV
jgi:hypothetical protein